ncbi:MAG: septum formation protein Maf [Tissierellia bacterium]|nr:septum formation protein Maf [Tissierellia bacterium]
MIILISASPRRRELLSMIYPEVIYDVSSADEPMDEKDPEKLVIKSARVKLKDRMHSYRAGILLASDTLVYCDGILGKPRDREEAYDMLSRLAGRTHEVYTSLVLHDRNSGKLVEDAVVTKVKFAPMTSREINTYLDTGEYKDKAGAYGIQGYGSVFIEAIEGDYFNVMGLPLNRLYEILRDEFDLNMLESEDSF